MAKKVRYNGGTESYYGCSDPTNLVVGKEYEVILSKDRGWQTDYTLKGVDGEFNCLKAVFRAHTVESEAAQHGLKPAPFLLHAHVSSPGSCGNGSKVNNVCTVGCHSGHTRERVRSTHPAGSPEGIRSEIDYSHYFQHNPKVLKEQHHGKDVKHKGLELE